MTTRKTKNFSITLFKIKGCVLSSTLQILCDRSKDKENIYITSHLTYKNYRIHLNKSITKYVVTGGFFNNKDDVNKESKIKELMKKNKSITIKEISKQTGFSKYIIGRFYMKLRRNLNGRMIK